MQDELEPRNRYFLDGREMQNVVWASPYPSEPPAEVCTIVTDPLGRPAVGVYGDVWFRRHTGLKVESLPVEYDGLAELCREALLSKVGEAQPIYENGRLLGWAIPAVEAEGAPLSVEELRALIGSTAEKVVFP